MATLEQHVAPTSATPHRGVVTPEAVRLEFDTAGVAARMVARFVDVWVAGAVSYAVAFSSILLGPSSALPVGILAGFAGFFGYPAVAEAVWGRTVGKSMVGLRVITVEGGPVGARHASIRSALQVVDLLLVPVAAVGVVSILAGRDDQRLGDRLAGTLVVRTGGTSFRSHAVAFPPLPGHEHYVASLDVSGVRPAHYELLRSFLTRVHELVPDARARVGHRLLAPTVAAVGKPPPPGMHPEAFLVSVVAAYQQRHGGPATWMFGPMGFPARPAVPGVPVPATVAPAAGGWRR